MIDLSYHQNDDVILINSFNEIDLNLSKKIKIISLSTFTLRFKENEESKKEIMFERCYFSILGMEQIENEVVLNNNKSKRKLDNDGFSSPAKKIKK